MNGYKRIKSAIEGEWPDKIPIMLHNFMMAAREAGYTMRQFREDPKVIAESFIRAVEKYRYDGILVDVDTVTLAGAVGVPVDFPEDEPARSNRGNLTSIEMVKDLGHPEVGKYKYVQVWLESVRILKDYFDDEVYIRGNCDQDPFSLASMMRGTENWMMDLLDREHEDLVFRLLDYCAEATTQFIELMSETGAHMVSNGDSPAGPELISPEMYKKYAYPYEKKIVDKAHELGLPYTLHICGNTEPILDKMIDTGTDCVEIDYKTDTLFSHEVCKDRVVFIGNIDPSGVLAMGTPELVKKKTLDLLKIFSDTPKFILNAGCAIPPITPQENLFAMIETARNFR